MPEEEILKPDRNRHRASPVAGLVIALLIGTAVVVYSLMSLNWQTISPPGMDLVPAAGWSERAERSLAAIQAEEAEEAAEPDQTGRPEETGGTTLDPYVLGLINEPLAEPTPIETLPAVQETAEPTALDSTQPENTEPAETTEPDPLSYLVAPLSEAVDSAYFADSVFIGSSRMQGIMYSNILPDAYWFVKQGLNVSTFFHEDMYLGDDLGTASAAYGLTLRDFNQVYLAFGINELLYTTDDFIAAYRQMVRWVRYYQPDAVIYLEAIMPVEVDYVHEWTNYQPYYNNDRIAEFNARIKQLAADEDCWYLDSWEAVADETGSLPDHASNDGLHLNDEWNAYYASWIASHIVPQPAGTE